MMNIAHLLDQLSYMPSGLRLVLDAGGQHFNVARVTRASGTGGAIIEAGDVVSDQMTVGGLAAAIIDYDLKTYANIFIKYGDDYGYYDIGSFAQVNGEYVMVTVGKLLQGSVLWRSPTS